jgi:hypothetical protein
MDPIECKVWHGDTKLYKKLDKLCRNPTEVETFWTLTKIWGKPPLNGLFKFPQTPQETAKWQMINILEIIERQEHCYWPAFTWLIGEICKHDSGLSYFQFVILVEVYLLDKDDDIHTVKMHSKNARSQRIMGDCGWDGRYIPEFICLEDAAIFNKIRYCDSNSDQGTKGEIYIPYLLITQQKTSEQDLEQS